VPSESPFVIPKLLYDMDMLFALFNSHGVSVSYLIVMDEKRVAIIEREREKIRWFGTI
jgi:hypothetical protein